jgi:aminoglycoside phosphotransferase (APT) family kinase protein
MDGLHEDEVTVDDALVTSLVADQFPRWSHLPLQRVPSTGTDNVVYRLGGDLAVRLPRIHWAVGQVEKEWEWLPRLSPRLPVSLPLPVARGSPGRGYPYPWLVSSWIHGSDVTAGPVVDWSDLARQVAEVAVALRRVDPCGAPAAGRRGGPLEAADDALRWTVDRLGDTVDARRALQVWEDALAAGPWPHDPVWVHGDLLPGNVLVSGGALAGIIDWSSAGTGDPACEAMFAWSLPPDARGAYRAALDLDDAAWRRGRGWTVEQAALFVWYYAGTLPEGVTAARRRLEAVLDDDVVGEAGR